MFFNFLSTAQCFLAKCEAPAVTAALPDSSFVLKHVSVLTRHGARSPLDKYLSPEFTGTWICDSTGAESTRVEAIPVVYPRLYHRIIDHRVTEFPPNCRRGELTVDGMREHRALGAAYREYLVNKTNFLNVNLSPKDIYARATSYDRTYRSAVAFLQGLYPPQHFNEILDIVTGVSDGDVLRPHKEFCSDIKKLYNDYIQLNDTIAQVKEAQEKLVPVCEYTHLDCAKLTQSSADRLCDYVNTMFCNERQLPPSITTEHFDFCMKYQGNQLFKLYGANDDTRAIGGSYAIREILRVLDSHLNGQITQKFALFSAHDSTVATVLAALGETLETIPPLASHLAMEVYIKDQEAYCRWVFNGNVLNLRLVNDYVGETPAGNLYKLSDFYQVYKPLIDQKTVCSDMP